MLFALFFLLTSAYSPLHAQARDSNYVLWEPIQHISNSVHQEAAPKLQVSENKVFLMWPTTTAAYSFFAQSTDYGLSWGAPVVLPDSGVSFYSSNAFAVAAPYMHFVTMYRPPPNLTPHFLWLRRWTIGDPGWGAGRPLRDSAYSNLVAASGQHVVIDYWWYSRGGGPYFAHSEDNGTTWTWHARTLPGGRKPNAMILVGQRLFLVRERNMYGSIPEIAFTYSTDFGATWATEIFISSLDTLISDLPHLAADSAGNVYVVWRDAKYGSTTGFNATILFRRSTDFGETWLPEQMISKHPTGTFSHVATDGQIILVVWDDERLVGGHTVRTVRGRATFDQGQSWSEEFSIAPEPQGGGGSDVLVSGGFVHVAWSVKLFPGPNLDIFYRRGIITVTGVLDISRVPGEIRLMQNYPNPFNSITRLEFCLPTLAHATVEIFNMLGQRIAIVADGIFDTGSHSVLWNASEHATGIYVVRLRVGGTIVQRKILFLK